VVLIEDAERLATVEEDLHVLVQLGCSVELVAGAGTPPGRLSDVPFRREPVLLTGTRAVRGLTRLLRRRAPSVRTAVDPVPGLSAGSTLLVLDEQLVPLLAGLHAARGTVHAGADAVTELCRRRERLESAALGTIDRLVRTGRHRAARQRIRSYRQVSTTAAATASAWAAAMELTDTGTGRIPTQVVTEALAAADRSWASGQAIPATHALGAAMRVLFHPVLHADVSDPPLARAPVPFLGPLRDSEMLQELVAGAGRRSAPAGGAPGSSGETRTAGPKVLVLPGSYPRFSTPLVTALRELPGSRVLVRALGDLDRRFNWLGMNTDVLAWRVAAHPAGGPAAAIGGAPEEHAAILDDFDVIVADWADRGAMWASIMHPGQARLVIRMHGMDLFSPWVHLIDWTRVDDLILVSTPLRQLAETILSDRLDGVRVHVIEHGVDATRFTVPRPPAADRTLGMIGWGKLVKDPAWTLDVLEHLLATDDDWRLLLVGEPLPRDGNTRVRHYAESFWERVDGPLAGHIELVPQTDDVPGHAARMGFVLSSSRRESFHLAVVEGVLAGAVPVVRDWPVYRGSVGPDQIFPPEWVVPDPQRAADRIHALGDPTLRQQAAEQAREEAMRRYHPNQFSERLRAVVTTPTTTR